MRNVWHIGILKKELMIEYFYPDRHIHVDLKKCAQKPHRNGLFYYSFCASSPFRNPRIVLFRASSRNYNICDHIRLLSLSSQTKKFTFEEKSSILTSISISSHVLVPPFSQKLWLTKQANLFKTQAFLSQKSLQTCTAFKVNICLTSPAPKRSCTKIYLRAVGWSTKSKAIMSESAQHLFQMSYKSLLQFKNKTQVCQASSLSNVKKLCGQSSQNFFLVRAELPRFAPFHTLRSASSLPDLLDIQRCGYNKFLQDGIPYVLSQITPIHLTYQNILIELVLNTANFQLVLPEDNPRDCVLKMTTYSCKLFVQAKIVYKTLSHQLLFKTQTEWVLIGHLPIMTKRGHFIINGSPRVIVHQAVRSPGIYFQQVLERDEKKKTLRFYGDLIPRRGVWLRFQTTPRGKIEAKLKKGKKVSAYTLKRCLQCLERIEKLRFQEKPFQKLVPTSTIKPNNVLGWGPLVPISFKAWDSSVFQRKETPKHAKTDQFFKKKSSFLSTRTFFDTDMMTFVHASEEKALLYAYDKLYRPAEEKERRSFLKKDKLRSLSKNFVVDRRFDSKRCYTNLFSTFKDKSRYDLSDLGRERINSKFGISVSEKQLTAADIYAVSDWLEKLSKGKKSVDDIDHFQNRRIRTSGELLHTQFENGIDRLQKFAWNRLKEFAQSNFGTQALTELRALSCTTRQTTPHPALVSQNKRIKRYTLDETNSNSFASSRDALFDFASQKKFKERFGLPYREKTPLLKNKSKLLCISIRDLLSTKPINGALRELFGINPLSQYMDQTNPLAETTHKRRLSSLGIGGVSRESAGMAIRGIHPTHYGRICPIETPEGKNAGLVNSLAFYAKINDNGFVETPYYKVMHGQVQHELGFTFFSAKRESIAHLKIAPSDLQKSWNNMLVSDHVPVRVADNLLDVFQNNSSRQVDCIGVSPVQMISVATSLIPFLEHNDANRALMGSNMQRQAVPLMISERPIVGTGLESLVVAESGHLIQSKATGFVSYVSSNKIVVDYLCCLTQKRMKSASCLDFRNENSGFGMQHIFQPQTDNKIQNVPIPSPSKKLLLSDVAFYTLHRRKKQTHKPYIFSSVFKLCHFSQSKAKTNEMCRTLQLKNWDAFYLQKTDLSKKKIEPKLFRPRKQTGRRKELKIEKFSFLHKRRLGDLKNILAKNSNNHTNRKTSFSFPTCLNNFVCFKKKENNLSTPIFTSQRLLSKKSSIPKKDYEYLWLNTSNSSRFQQFVSFEHVLNNFDRSNQDTCFVQRALVNEGDWVQKGDILTDCSASDQGQLAVGKNILVAYIPWEGYNFEDAIVISERLVKEDVYTSLHIERYELNAQDIREASEWFTKDLPGIPAEKLAHLDNFGLPKIGSFVKEGDILVGKMRYSNKKPTTAYERLLCDIIGENNFSARDSSLYVPKGVHARVIQHKIVAFFENALHGRPNQEKKPKQVHIFLGEKRPIQVGDKMSGRHGNKGVVATILPRQDMPYLADGTPVDIILNPLGVPSRMNVGQVFEALMGLAGTYLSQHFKLIPFDERYGVEASQSLVYLKLYQARLQSGQNWLFQIDFPGKTRIIDGRSGESFHQWITVGKAYILKLIHMVNEKIHARATGPYALITQQPLRGRSQKGGQRLGEMEVWALEGFGAAYILQELLTKKSDDMVGRKEVASALLPRPLSMKDNIETVNTQNHNRFLLGQSEIFKVLMCELQALCLDVGVYSLTTQSFQRSFLSSVHENLPSQVTLRSNA